jgi:hypothetical protein
MAKTPKADYVLNAIVQGVLQDVASRVVGQGEAERAVDEYRSLFLKGMCMQIGGIWPPPLARENADGSFDLMDGITAAVRAAATRVIKDDVRKPFRKAAGEYLEGYSSKRVAAATISRWINWGIKAACFAWEDTKETGQADLDYDQIVGVLDALHTTKGKSAERIVKDHHRLHAWCLYLTPSIDAAESEYNADLRAAVEKQAADEKTRIDKIRDDAFEAGKRAALEALPTSVTDALAEHAMSTPDDDDDTPAKRRRRA